MTECLHSFCAKAIKKKLFYCLKKVKHTNLCCKKCNKKEDLVIYLRSMTVYCKKESHYFEKHHVLFYDIQNKSMICTYCDKITPIGNVTLPNSLFLKFIELPKSSYRVLEGNVIKGFQNLGNTCYINSLFHILLNINKFKRGIINENHPIQTCGTIFNNHQACGDIILTNDQTCGGTILNKDQTCGTIITKDHLIQTCLICNIKMIIKKMNSDKELTLKGLVSCIMNFSSEYRNDDQHDIHTLYLNVVENIQKHITRTDGNGFIDRLFYGNINSTLRCLQCDFKRHTIEAFCSVSLKHTKTLNDSLSEYFRDEHMEDKLYCLNCKDHTVFSKSLEVVQVPEILVIHILRFEFINTITKINNGIEVYEKIEFGNCKYVLKGFVQHRGSIEQGHYLSYMRFGILWYEFDDNNVRKLSHKNVPFQDAYLLFFVRGKEREYRNVCL